MGVANDYSTGRASNTNKNAHKLRATLERVTDKPLSFRELCQAFGTTCFASRVARQQLAAYFPVGKLIRRRASEIISKRRKWDEPTSILKAVIPLWRAWIEDLLVAQPVRHSAAVAGAPTWLLVTDASTTGFSGVLFDPSHRALSPALGRVGPEAHLRRHRLSRSRRCCSEPKRIRAPSVAQHRTNRDPRGQTPRRSTTLSKGHAREFRLNNAIARVQQILRGDRPVSIWLRVHNINISLTACLEATELETSQAACGPNGRWPSGKAMRVTLPLDGLNFIFSTAIFWVFG